ncbi:hypothetical protein EV702DRAFT_264324 [Suillus placidus]|uniref:Uncharacterized protein n=1 Tax=Suillus placidus TaxID=48579 RepID=A0A9P6ZVF5_9AGAM|nr:hypothetical protein EV702DRAFT_264324 [Suillus placidus]
MNSFKKMFQKSNDDQTASLKHSKSMPYLLSSEGRTREHRANPSKPVYRGKTPLKKSDIVYVEQAPGVLELYHGDVSQNTYYYEPTRADFDTRADLLAKFPHSPEPIEGLPRSGFRAISLNSKRIKPQVPVHNSSTSGQQAYPSIPRRKQRHEATVDQTSANLLQVPDDHTRNGGLAERIRAKSSTGRSYTPAPPIPTTRSPRPILSRSAHSSRVNIHHVPSPVAIPVTAAPDHGHPSRPRRDYREFLEEQDPNIIRRMINQYPIAPLCSERTPEHLRPIRFDMVDPRYFQKTFRETIAMAVAQGRPLDARAGGLFRRIIDMDDIIGIVPETGGDRSRQVAHR